MVREASYNPQPRGESILDSAEASTSARLTLTRPQGNKMICNNVVVTVKDVQDVDEIRSLLLEQTRLSRLEPGCERFELYQSQADPKVFILVERWSSTEALDQHRLAKAYTEIYKPKVLPKVDRTPHPCMLLEP